MSGDALKRRVRQRTRVGASTAVTKNMKRRTREGNKRAVGSGLGRMGSGDRCDRRSFSCRRGIR